MIGELKPYDAYKDSGEIWLGRVPESWKLPRTKNVLNERSQKGFPEEPLLAATQTKGVVRKDQYENRTVLALKDLHLLKLVRVNDFVISLRSFQGGIEYAREQGIISPAYTILYPQDRHNHGFLSWLFKSKPYVENLSLFVTGIRQGQNIDYTRLSRSKIVLPPVEEQAAIAQFLDYADRRIRRYIRTKQKLIRLLEEQKQAVINEAVTRGLDSDIPLKSSGIEWLGDIPAHWKVCRLRDILTDGPRNGISPPVSESGKSVESFSISAVRNGILDIQPDDVKHVVSDQISNFDKYRLKAGDVLLVRGNGNISSVGKAGLVEKDMPEKIYPDILMRLRFDSTVNPSYVIKLLNCFTSRAQIENAAKTTVGTYKVNNQQVRQLWIALPSCEEQLYILEKTEQLTSDISACLLRANSEIDLLGEFRTRLIADVVTGKLDVREAAAKLPTETEEFEISDLDSTENDIVSDDIDFDEPLDNEAA